MACHVIRDSALVLTMQDKYVLTGLDGGFQLIVPSHIRQMIENENIYYVFSNKFSETSI